MAYYKTIKGIKYDKILLELAESLVKGKGDGRLSQKDSQKLFKKVKDGGKYTDIEKRTVKFIRENYKFSPSGDKWFRTEIKKWAAKKNQKKPTSKNYSRKKISETSQVIQQSKNHEPQKPKIKYGFKSIILVIMLISLIILIFGYPYIKNIKNSHKEISEKKQTLKENIPEKLPEKKINMEIKKIEKINIFFSKNLAWISHKQRPKLKPIISYLKKNPDSKILITGHSCNLGSNKTNQELALFRARKIAHYLQNKGIKKQQIIIKGVYHPDLNKNETEEKRQLNRRVEFNLQEIF